MIVFDAKDIDYLINHFSVDQLRKEISHAREHLKGEVEYQWQAIDEDYINSCQLAIDIRSGSEPKRNKPIAQFRESIESIKSRYDLSEYVGRFIHLSKSGNKFQGLCPFHADKNSKSFFVYPGHWHCFGCQKSGSIIDFEMLYQNVDLKDAIARLSR